MELHALDNLVQHGLSVEGGKALNQLHIVDILVKQRPGDIGQLPGDGGLLLAFPPLQFLLNLLLPAGRLELGNQLIQRDLVGVV